MKTFVKIFVLRKNIFAKTFVIMKIFAKTFVKTKTFRKNENFREKISENFTKTCSFLRKDI
jgi:hypothetical protein